MKNSIEELGRVAYETASKVSRWNSGWSDLPTSSKTSWMRIAKSVELLVTKRVLDRLAETLPKSRFELNAADAAKKFSDAFGKKFIAKEVADTSPRPSPHSAKSERGKLYENAR